MTASPRAFGGAAARAAPAAVLVALACTTAWSDRGSVAAADWLPYAIVAALLAAAVLVSGGAVQPPLQLALGSLALLSLAGWVALSLTWSPSPALARDEALLTGLYAVALIVPGVTLREARERRLALGSVVAGLGGLAVATGVHLALATDPDSVYLGGRLDFPVSYPNAAAAFFLVGFWPALALAARRAAPVAARAGGLAAATATLGGWALAQSKGGALGLAVSAAVVFSVSQHRLRLLLPAALVAATVGAAFVSLTAPFRAGTGFDARLDAIRGAGRTELVVTAAGLVLGVLYALVDARVMVPVQTRRFAARSIQAALVAAAATALAVFFASVDHPGRYAQDRWESFKHLPTREAGQTHLLSLGSNRYDFWRVALGEIRDHPLAGIGARGFRAAYLEHRSSSEETPARAHSLELDALAETGVVGFGLLVLAFGLPLARLARGARTELAAAGALAAVVSYLGHATVDWIWTFPSVTLPLLVVLGAGAASRRPRSRLRTAVALPAALAATALALLAFVPPWLAARYTEQALRGSADAARDLRWAERLDPLSTEPLVARWALAPTPAAGVPPLVRAVRKEPRSVDLRYLLGRQYLAAGRRADAARTLRLALRLDPLEPGIRRALRRASR